MVDALPSSLEGYPLCNFSFLEGRSILSYRLDHAFHVGLLKAQNMRLFLEYVQLLEYRLDVSCPPS